MVLAGCIVTAICVRFMFGHSFSTWRLHLRGETIRSANDVGWLRNLTVERLMRSDVGKVPSTTTIAACRREFVLGSRPAIVIVNNADEYVGLVLLPELFSGDLDTIADEIQVMELARLIDDRADPGNERQVRDGGVRRGGSRDAGGGGIRPKAARWSASSRETFARRRYVEEIDKATRGVLGALSGHSRRRNHGSGTACFVRRRPRRLSAWLRWGSDDARHDPSDQWQHHQQRGKGDEP